MKTSGESVGIRTRKIITQPLEASDPPAKIAGRRYDHSEARTGLLPSDSQSLALVFQNKHNLALKRS